MTPKLPVPHTLERKELLGKCRIGIHHRCLQLLHAGLLDAWWYCCVQSPVVLSRSILPRR